MENTIKIPNDIVSKTRKLVEENPELPYHFIQDILIGMEELKSGQVNPYIFHEGKT